MSVKFYPLRFSVTLWCADIALQSVKPPNKKKKAQKAETVLSAVIYMYIYISVSCLKLVCCETDVCLLRVFGFNCGLIHNFVHQAFSIQWEFFFFPAVALFFLRLAVAVLFRCYSIWLCCGHLSTA